ncbi:MAG: Holliday junction resolvase RuvX [Bdellovibrionota bacterium]
MAKYLGIDVGSKNVGIATADVNSPIATPYGTFDRAQGKSEKKVLELIESEEIKLIIVGLPLDVSGKLSDQCRDILDYTRRLKRRTDVKISYIDEHLSSYEAETKLNQAGVLQVPGVLDRAAATIILQTYLDNKESLVLIKEEDLEEIK